MLRDELARLQDQVIHHSANFAAITIPAMSWFLKAPPYFLAATSILGFLWYCVLFGEKIYGWVQAYKKKRLTRATPL